MRNYIVNAAEIGLCLICILVCLGSGSIVRGQTTGTVENFKLPQGFEAELIHRVPQDQGSWVAITNDPQGRLITSDQYGKLYRLTTRETGPADIEPIDLKIGFAQGLLCAFDSLYVVAHPDSESNRPAGLFRVRDTDGDDQYDAVQLLRQFEGEGEHGPHAVILGPDQESLYVCGGNHTKIPDLETSRVPRTWQEDGLLSRLPDPGGHAVYPDNLPPVVTGWRKEITVSPVSNYVRRTGIDGQG